MVVVVGKVVVVFQWLTLFVFCVGFIQVAALIASLEAL